MGSVKYQIFVVIDPGDQVDFLYEFFLNVFDTLQEAQKSLEEMVPKIQNGFLDDSKGIWYPPHRIVRMEIKEAKFHEPIV